MSFKGPILTQASPLLNLPAELRNHIYEYAVSDTETVYFKRDALLYMPALSLSCRQIRHEYETLFRGEAAHYAKHICLEIVDFDSRTCRTSLPYIMELVEAKRQNVPADADPSDRLQVTIGLHLTNTFDPIGLQPLRKHLRDKGLTWNLTSPPENFAIELSWNPRSFDIVYLREVISRLPVHMPGLRATLEQAFRAACARYTLLGERRERRWACGRKQKRQALDARIQKTKKKTRTV